MSCSQIEQTNDQSQTARSNLIAAFKRVIKRAGRPQATDLHVRRLLLYVQAKDQDGAGLQRSLKQLSDKLYLTESTCRRVIRRAAKHFGLLAVTEQRHTPGGQTVNRYSINWKQVDALLCDEHPENTHVCRNKSTDLLKSRARSKRIPFRSPIHISCRRLPVRLAAALCPGAPSCCRLEQSQHISGNFCDTPVSIDQPDKTTARAARSARISKVDFSPPNFIPGALSDQAPDLKSRARSKRILHSSEGTRFPSPMWHVVHESQCSTTPRSTSYRVLSPIMRPRTTLLSLCQSGSTPRSTDVPVDSSDLSSSTLPPRTNRQPPAINRFCVPPRPLR